jgi:hypothetical protein
LAYELETIETKITENIFLAASESITVDVPEFLKELDTECAKVKRAFKHQVVSFENENLVKRYFHFHQESLIDLINNIRPNPQEGHPTRDLAQSIMVRLSALLVYLEEHFPEYFDLDMRMPNAAMGAVRDELNIFMFVISKRLQSTAIDIGLIELLKNSITVYLKDSESISFRKFYHLKMLRTSIEKIDSSFAAGVDTMDVIRVLIHCNYNTEEFFNYFIRYISWAVNKAQIVSEKLDQLAFFLKFSNQEPCMVDRGYNYNDPPINIQIADWISQEIQYLKHKQQLALSANSEETSLADFKLNFDLSVSHVAYIFRLFIEAGVIQNKNTSELIRFLIKYVKTKRSESISYESFRIKYYSIENGTKDAVKKTLQYLLNFVGKT